MTYTYHSDGHYKATIEDVFGGLDAAQLQEGSAPWHMGYQTHERNLKWNVDLAMRLGVKLAAKDGGLSEEKIRAKLDELVALLPDIKARLPSLKPEIILRLVKDTDAVAQKLLQLKCAFPGADCGRMLVKEMALMRETAESLARRAQALRAFLPAADIDAIAQEHPSILSVDSFKQAVNDARRLMPGADIENMLVTDPDFVLSLQKGTDMIPYDAVPENPWGHK